MKNVLTTHYSLSRFAKEISHLSKKFSHVQKYQSLGSGTPSKQQVIEKKILLLHYGLNLT